MKFRRRGQKAELQICPFCDGGDTPDKWTCVVYLDSEGGNFKCMRGSCDRSGSFWQFVEHYGDDPKEYYKDFQPREVNLLKQPVKFKTEPVKSLPLTDTALAYLKKRGFTEDTLENVSIWCDDKGNINFGYYHKGECCMTKVRAPRKPGKDEIKAWQGWKGGLRTLWGLEDCDLSIPAITIVFGEYDRIACMQAGLGNVVSVPCGDSDLEWISVCFDELEKMESVTLWIDADDAGQKALPKIAERLGQHKIRVVRTKHKDANEMLVYRAREVGEETAYAEMWDAVAEAEWFWKGDIIEVADIQDEDQCFDGYLSGIEFLDRTLGGFYFHRMTVHMGDTKHGKTEAVTQMACNALEQGGTVCVWTGEDSPQDYKYKIQVHLAGFEGIESRVSNRSGREYSYVLPEYKARIDEYLRGKLFLLNKQSGVTEDTLIENFELAYKRFGCSVFILDNLMKAVASKDTINVNHRQTQVVNKYSDFTKRFRVHGHLVVHTNKAGEESEPPTRKNVSGAKEIINLADNVLGWWRIPEDVKHNYENANAWCGVLANRVHGDEGSVNLRYDPRVRKFTSTSEEMMRTYSI